MSKLKYSILGAFTICILSTACMAQTAKKCFIIPDKDQNQKITIDEAISWTETVPVLVTCDNEQMYTLYSFDISIFQRKPLMNKGFGTGIEGVPLMAARAIKEARPGDTIVLQNIICKSEEGNDIELPMVSIELEAGEMKATDGDQKEE